MLVAHPSPEIRAMLAGKFQAMGCAVRTTGSGAHAISWATLARPEIAVIGVGLDDGAGRQVSEKLKRHSPRTVVILTPVQEADLRREVTRIIHGWFKVSPEVKERAG